MSFNKDLLYAIAQNVLFWAISFAITLNLFSRGDEITTLDWIYTLLFNIPFFIVVTLNIYQGIPNILYRYNIWFYLLTVLVIGSALTVSLYSLSYGWFSNLVFPSYYFVGVYTPLELLGIMGIYVIISTLIELSKAWFNRKETQLEISRLEEEKTKSELKALQAQINPHFLFNSLNTIYGEAIRKSDKAPLMILELSDILRYVVDHMNKERVSLKSEIEYIKKFVSLQKKRLSHPERVLLTIEGSAENLEISPLLLITYIENTFKHGSVSSLDEQIKIHIKISSTSISLVCENPKNLIEVIEENKNSGTGLENTKKRLDFLYKHNYSLTITDQKEYYKSELTIDLS